MTITRYSKEWNMAMLVLVAYGLLGIALVLLPMPPSGPLFKISNLPMIEALRPYAYDAKRVEFLWSWMITAFPLLFLLFSSVAPIKIPEGKLRDPVWPSVVGFAFFGLVVCPLLIWMIFFNNLNVGGRIDRLILSSGHGPWSLCFVGSTLMIMILVMAWWSYIAIPVSVYKLVKFRAVK